MWDYIFTEKYLINKSYFISKNVGKFENKRIFSITSCLQSFKIISTFDFHTTITFSIHFYPFSVKFGYLELIDFSELLVFQKSTFELDKNSLIFNL